VRGSPYPKVAAAHWPQAGLAEPHEQQEKAQMLSKGGTIPPVRVDRHYEEPAEYGGMSALLGQLAELRDLVTIRKAVLALCNSVGRVRYCLFEHNREERVLQCYVQLINRELHDGLAYRLGGYVRGRELYIPIPVPGDFAMPKEPAQRQ
jgi:hypothetical protein